MKCIYCDGDYYKRSSLMHIFATKDPLCETCRKGLVYAPKTLHINDLRVRSFYKYEGLMKELILQYKEAGDEALYKVFFYPLIGNITLRYFGYHIITVPSSQSKLARRGYDHMQLMTSILPMKVGPKLKMKEDFDQVGKSKEERTAMLDNIVLAEDVSLPSKILLIDDVFTTGNSIYGAYKALGKPKTLKAITLSYVDH